jgi:phage-related minor tail protein
MKVKLLAVTPLLWLLVSAPLVLAQTTSGTPPDPVRGSAAMGSTVRSDARPIEDLQLAAQRLRDAIHALAKAPAGAPRNQTITDANRALAEVQAAMANLPPDLLVAAATESDYQQAVDRLQQAAQKLRDAAHALATDPYSTRRNETILDINKALLETQQVMIDVPISAWK